MNSIGHRIGLRPGWAAPLAAAVLLSLFAWRGIEVSAGSSATYDEPVYAAAGYTYARLGDYRFRQDAPPLVTRLAGHTLILWERLFGVTLKLPVDHPSWEEEREYAFADAFLAANAQYAHTILRVARLPITALGVLLCLLLYLASSRWFGRAGGLITLALASLDPNLGAHAAILSTDLALALFFFGAHLFLFRLLKAPSWWAAVGVAVFSALALAAKFTGLLLVPSLALVAAVHLGRRLVGERRGAQPGQTESSLPLTMLWVLRAGLLSLFATSVLLLFLYQGDQPLTRYLGGVGAIYVNAAPGHLFYLHGRFSGETWLHYYLVAILVKTPLPALLLVGLGFAVGSAAKARRGLMLSLVLPVLVVLAVCAFDQANLGLRRVLLVYPFLFAAAGALGPWIGDLWRAASGDAAARDLGIPRLARGPAVILALLFSAGSAWAIHPHPLAFFNLAAGGPNQGWRWLADSNLDWGQDLPGLAAYVGEAELEEVVLSYFGRDDPSRYGIPWRPPGEEGSQASELNDPGPAVYALSVHHLIYFRRLAEVLGSPGADWLGTRVPTCTVGHSIHVYDLRLEEPAKRPRSPPRCDAAAAAAAREDGGEVGDGVGDDRRRPLEVDRERLK